jgi:dipeptidyl aminopeptidase/acylaminoacyl peptidase
MTAWLVTQDRRFAAAAAVAPTTDWFSQQLTCHIPDFCELFLSGKIDDPTSQYHSRSPALHAGTVTTPTLNVCGALDQSTPPGQALEFHNALQLRGVPSALVTYPREGHGVRHYPAVIDFAARLVDWFEHYLPPPQA